MEAGRRLRAAFTRRPAQVAATVVASLAVLAFVAGTIGPPLVGRGVFLTHDLIYFAYPWQAYEDPVADLDAGHGGPTSDTVDAIFPARAVFGASARSGDFDAWNTMVGGGEPYGSTSSAGQLNPLAWPYVLGPAWLAPALVKLAGLLTAVTFTYLFCRRLSTDRVPALLAGVTFAGSGFMVMWTNWPQTDVASLIPVLFWATERFLQRRTAAASVPIAVALALMLLAQFPAVVGYTLCALAGYVVLRLGAAVWATPADEPAPADGTRDADDPSAGEPPAGAVEAPADDAPDAAEPPVGSRLPLRRALAIGAGAGAAVAAGVLLVAVVLLPFANQLSGSGLDRAQDADDHLHLPTLVTTVAPSAFGLSTLGVNYAGPALNQVESISYVGVVACLLVLAAVALPRVRRVPPGAVAGLAAPTAVLGAAVFGGGPVLSLLQVVPLFKTNYIGRNLSILGFMVAALGALGLQALLERGRGRQARPLGRPGWVRVTVVGVAGLGLAVTVALRGRDWARGHERATTFSDAVDQAGLFGLLAVAGIVALLVTRGHARPLVAALLVVVAAAQGLAFTLPLLPNESRDTLYPVTPGIAYLRENIGDDRLAAEGSTFYGNTTMLFGLRNAGGHSFFPPTWKEMLRMASPDAFDSSPTLSNLAGTPESAATPIYDRMGVRYFVGRPGHSPFGPREGDSLDETVCESPDADLVTVLPGATPPAQPPPDAPDDVLARLRLPGGTGLRAVVVRACEDAHLDHGAALEVTASAGGETATGTLPLRPTVQSSDLVMPVAGDLLAGEEDIDVTIRLRGGPPEALTLASTSEGTLATNLIRPGDDDGLRLAFAGDLRIYERLDALPRVRWAGRSQVIEDPDERLATLAGGRVPDDTVILGQGEPGGSGAGGTVEQVAAGDTLRLEVDAAGDGYAVVADAMQSGWAATVDGRAVEILDADHAGVAVAVPAGRHVVEFSYRPEGRRVGFVLSLLSAAGLVAAVGWTTVRRRRSARAGTSARGDGPAADRSPAPVPPAETAAVVGDPKAGVRDTSTEVPS